ncbi:MAG: serine/threonine protein kinase, partial [Planctomycetes bacterium]|nr:serine/threonine protein kinase [Planctomycetota bacterium]
MSSNGEREANDPVQIALETFRQAWHAGKRLDPTLFCDAHPESGPELREQIDEFLFVAQNLRLGPEGGNNAHKVFPGSPGIDESRERIFGDYRIIREIGRGGMGVVYEAEEISLKRRVAIKILPSHLSFSDHAVQKFRREAEAGGRQVHPGIVVVYAVGSHNGIHFISQELVGHGYTLADRIEELHNSGKLPPDYFRQTAALLVDAAAAMEHAHSSGVIHRDIKPSNILLTQSGKPKITDFGLAKVEDALALTRSGDFAGTPYYMSPEQASQQRGHGIDLRTDVFSLGVTLYEMLTLERPFKGKTSHEVLTSVLHDEPADPRRINCRIPTDLAVICLKAMEKEREQRYATMGDFHRDLDRFLKGEAILARPAGAGTRLWKRIKRKPAFSAAIALAFLSVLAAIVLLYTLYKRSEAQEKNKALELADSSSTLLETRPAEALSQALEAFQTDSNLVTNNAVFAALGACRKNKIFYHDQAATYVAWHPFVQQAAAGLRDGTVAIWDIEAGRELLRLTGGHERAINHLSFSPDGSRLVTASDDDSAVVWDLKNQKPLFHLTGHTNRVLSAVFDPTGRYIVTASADLIVRVWEVATQKEILMLKGHGWIVNHAVFSPDGKWIATASDDTIIRIWNARTGERADEIKGHQGPVFSVAFDSSGKHIVSASEDKTACIWDV